MLARINDLKSHHKNLNHRTGFLIEFWKVKILYLFLIITQLSETRLFDLEIYPKSCLRIIAKILFNNNLEIFLLPVE